MFLHLYSNTHTHREKERQLYCHYANKNFVVTVFPLLEIGRQFHKLFIIIPEQSLYYEAARE